MVENLIDRRDSDGDSRMSKLKISDLKIYEWFGEFHNAGNTMDSSEVGWAGTADEELGYCWSDRVQSD